jgi:hypothetical protein
MKRTSDLATLPLALEWLRSHVDELADVPIRLHDHAVGDKDALGAPRFSGAFWHRLVGSAYATHVARLEESCYHPMKHQAECPECFGTNVKTTQRDVYDRPLSAAMVSLAKIPAPSLGTPSPVQYILALLQAGLVIEPAAYLVRIPIVSADHRLTVEAMFLRAIRQLHSRYSSGPIGGPKWTDMSESQRNAIQAA